MMSKSISRICWRTSLLRCLTIALLIALHWDGECGFNSNVACDHHAASYYPSACVDYSTSSCKTPSLASATGRVALDCYCLGTSLSWKGVCEGGSSCSSTLWSYQEGDYWSSCESWSTISCALWSHQRSEGSRVHHKDREGCWTSTSCSCHCEDHPWHLSSDWRANRNPSCGVETRACQGRASSSCKSCDSTSSTSCKRVQLVVASLTSLLYSIMFPSSFML